jgi:hypothetical protein
VIELNNDGLALLGNNCGKDQFGIEFKRVERDFHAQRNRQRDLQRIIEIRELLPPLEAELEMLRRSAAAAAFDGYMAGLRSFGKLRSVLRRIAQQNHGLLACTSYYRDREAELRYAETLPHAKHHQQRIEGAKTEYLRRTRIEEYQRWVESLPPVECEKIETFGRLLGGGIFELPFNETLVASMKATRDAVRVHADEFLTNRSDYWTKRRLVRAIQMLRLRVGLANRAIALLDELDRFTSVENLAKIAAWSEREVELPQPRIDFSVRASGRTLIDEDDRTQLGLPESWTVPTLPHMAALLAKLGELLD